MRRLIAILLAAGISFGSRAADLTVSAASSLTQAFRELAPLFQSRHPQTGVRLNFGASGALLQQAAKGAPVDVLATADQDTLDLAQQQGLLAAGTRRDFAANRLVLVVPSSSTFAPGALADLARPAVARIAIGLPSSVPAGRYAKAALEAAGLWEVVQPKTIGAVNVRQALDYVSRAEVDAAFVYATDAALMPDRVKVMLTVPTPTPLRYPVAVLAAAPNPGEARRFVEFLASPQGQAVLARHGFGRP